MSLNVHFFAVCGKKRIEIPARQTPTDVSLRIQKAGNPVEEYCRWVVESANKKYKKEEMEYVKGFKEEVESFRKEGYQIVVEVW